MLFYARSDTHFLLYIYDNLRSALIQSTQGAEAPLLDVLKRSAKTALRTYVPEVYDAEGGTGPGGWEALGRKWNRSLAGGDVQAAVFKAVHTWRDSVARAEDESTRYVRDVVRGVQPAHAPPFGLQIRAAEPLCIPACTKAAAGPPGSALDFPACPAARADALA